MVEKVNYPFPVHYDPDSAPLMTANLKNPNAHQTIHLTELIHRTELRYTKKVAHLQPKSIQGWPTYCRVCSMMQFLLNPSCGPAGDKESWERQVMKFLLTSYTTPRAIMGLWSTTALQQLFCWQRSIKAWGHVQPKTEGLDLADRAASKICPILSTIYPISSLSLSWTTTTTNLPGSTVSLLCAVARPSACQPLHQ